jgi:CrcB protein
MRWWWIFVAGGGGALLRVAVVEWFGARSVGHFPWGVLAVNTLGCFAIGLLVALVEVRLALTPGARTAIQAGLLGGLTTFSAFGLDTVRLVEAGEHGLAVLNGAGNLGLGVVAVVLGLSLGRGLG